LPEFIKVDVSACELGDSIHLSDLKLPEGVELVELTHDNDQTIANLTLIEEAPIETAAPVAAGEVPATEVKEKEPVAAAKPAKGKD
jgi:large subunit ribosomal protein L25